MSEHMTPVIACPNCGSADYGYDALPDGGKHWSCLDCKLGIDDGESREYHAQYDYACGYWD